MKINEDKTTEINKRVLIKPMLKKIKKKKDSSLGNDANGKIRIQRETNRIKNITFIFLIREFLFAVSSTKSFSKNFFSCFS
jgi:hypothetical protein